MPLIQHFVIKNVLQYRFRKRTPQKLLKINLKPYLTNGKCICFSRRKNRMDIDHLRQIWKPEYYDFDLIINKVLNQDTTIINFDQVINLSFNEFELLLIK